MNKFNDALIYLTSIAIVAILMYLDFVLEIFPQNINYEFSISQFFQKLLAYICLAYLIYMVIVGRKVSDKKRVFRNLFILLIGNFFIYSIIFYLTPHARIEYFLSAESTIYFKWYFVYSVWASFIGSKIFYDYRQEIIKEGYNSYVFIKYFSQAIISNLLLYYVFVKIINPILREDIFYNQLANYIVIGIISAIFLAIFYFIDRKKNILESKIVEQSTKAETATANFETLKNQLDPHFLFNSLNVLTGLIEENPDKAVDFTTSLSKIYRYLLEQKDKEIVPLEDEIKFAKTYINLLKLRFENSIDFNLEIEELKENEFIIPLSLQILLENTIKHNIVSEAKPLKIRIYKENKHLIVENSYQPKISVKDSTGVGLNNIKNRYQLISNQKIDIQQTEEQFRVKLPILTQKIKVLEGDQISFQEAIERTTELKEFYNTLITIALGNVFLLAINYLTSPDYWWYLFILLGTVISITIMTVKVFGFNKNWEARKTEEILEKKKQSKKWN